MFDGKGLFSPSIARNLTVGLLLAVASVSLAVAVLLYQHGVRTSRAELEVRADEYIAYLADMVEIPLWELNRQALEQIERSFAGNELVVGLRLVDPAGSVFFDLHKGEGADDVRRTVEVVHAGRIIGHIELSLTTRMARQENRRLLFASLFTVFLILLVVLALTGIMLRRFLRQPLEDLRRLADRYAAGKYGPGDEGTAAREFRPVVRALGDMGRRIETQVEELSAAEEKYRSIVEHAVEGIFQAAPDGRLLSANPSLAVMLGYPSPDVALTAVDGLWQRLFSRAEDREPVLETLQAQDRVKGIVTLARRGDGGRIWVSLSVRAVRDAQGAFAFYEGSLWDVTEHKEREEAERKREAAEAMSEAKSRFLARMSHGMRTPLHTVLGMTEMVLRTELTSRQRELLDASR